MAPPNLEEIREAAMKRARMTQAFLRKADGSAARDAIRALAQALASAFEPTLDADEVQDLADDFSIAFRRDAPMVCDRFQQMRRPRAERPTSPAPIEVQPVIESPLDPSTPLPVA